MPDLNYVDKICKGQRDKDPHKVQYPMTRPMVMIRQMNIDNNHSMSFHTDARTQAQY